MQSFWSHAAVGLAVLGASWAANARAQGPAPIPVTITVDAAQPKGPLKPIWRWVGYDEPNYTYGTIGKKLIGQLAEDKDRFGPAFFRAHSLLVTGDGKGALKWGSTNAYTEDAAGKPVYDWTVVDKIFDTYIQAGAKPFAQIGFMPQALSLRPEPYKHHWKPGDNYNDIYTGWTTPPKDYDKWRDLVSTWVRHSIERYGKAEVESWYWELWNEPDIGYFSASGDKPNDFDQKVKDYCKMYDYAADGLKKALPTAKIGGAEVTGGAQRFQREFLKHVLDGTNYATGQKGSPLDLVSFHAKGAPENIRAANGVPEHVRMGIANQLRNIDAHFAVVAERPETKNLPIVIGESDPDGCAACPSTLYPSNGYRNGTLYAVYTVNQIVRTLDLAEKHGVNILGATTWAFTFEDQPIFGGFRQLATNGIEMPVLNSFRMLNKLGKQRLPVTSNGDLGHDAMMARAQNGRGFAGVRGEKPDVHAIAARDDRRITLISWNYHDDDLPGPAAEITVEINGIPADAQSLKRAEWRIDETHSNAYTAWKKMGSPATPDPAQYKDLEAAARLQPYGETGTVSATGGKTSLKLSLPRQAVSLVELSW
jgi:xylan 1,4-beta-xylosidase